VSRRAPTSLQAHAHDDHVAGVPAVFFAEEFGDEFDAELGGLVLLVLERVVFDDVDADDIAAAADVFGDGGNLAVGQALGVGHAGAGSVDAVDAVEVEADPDVRDALARSSIMFEQGSQAGSEQVEQGKGCEAFALDEVEFGLVEVAAADMEQVFLGSLVLVACGRGELGGAEAHQGGEVHAVDVAAQGRFVGVHVAVGVEVDDADVAVDCR
jgi:hypothetical protein